MFARKPFPDERPRRIFWCDLDILKTCCFEHALKVSDLRSAGHTPSVSSPIGFNLVGERRGRDHVGNGKLSTRFKHAEGFIEDPLLLRGEIDYTVRDNHIDAVVRDR